MADNEPRTALSSTSLLEAFNHRGPEGFPSAIDGHVAVIAIDLNRSQVLSASDRYGVHALYWAHTGPYLVVATSAALVIRSGLIPASITPQALFNYVYFHVVPAPGTAFAGMQRLQAAQQLYRPTGDDLSIRRYWAPAFDGRRGKARVPADGELLRRTLRAGVEKALQASPPATGAFLSGGLDSSTVAGMLAELHPGDARAFAIGFEADGYDEMAYARATARHFGLKLHEYYVTPDDIVTSLPDVVGAQSEPFGNSSALPAYFCARLARESGMQCLLAGDGGDELFGGNERYAHQMVFERYLRLPLFLRSGIVEPLVKLAPAGLPLARKAQSFLSQARVPLPLRLQHYNFLNQYPAEEVFSEGVLKAADQQQPGQLLEFLYGVPDNASTLDRMLFLDWQITLADNDLRKVSSACGLAGIGVSYPMLDEELVALSMTIPDKQKIKGRNLRYFYKEALRGWLPDITISKSKKGFGLPFGVWLREHPALRDMAIENLQALRKRDLFKDSFIEDTLRKHADGHAAYFGELVWLLLVLELWLKANPDAMLTA
ncbi:asparagine synthase-related protein [Pseudohaliea sp.]|uniref:asparagine synthetase B family protein n=1 Tax=Pseudohaliea sp. TaxID=2740289 RepID=UPI0032EC3CE2